MVFMSKVRGCTDCHCGKDWPDYWIDVIDKRGKWHCEYCAYECFG